MSPPQGSKTRPTFYTPERVEAARENVDTHEWARELKEAAVADADTFLDRGLDEIWGLVTGQAIPRAGAAGDGTQRERWAPVDGRPWKVTDGEWTLPTNDFAAYRLSGLDDRGWFDPALADDELLVNEEHPEMGANWGVDDGTGWEDTDGDVAEPGTVLVPIALYNHYYRWYELRDAVQALRDAYLYTGSARYAVAGIVLLDRIADAYPEMDISAYSQERFWNSHGGPGQGKIVGSIWETNIVRVFVGAYDAFFPELQDPRAIEFLDAKAEEYPALPEKSSAAAIGGNIESGLVREVLPAVEQAQIRGNLGMHQAALAMAAVVMDDPDGYTADALEFLFRPGRLETVDGIPFAEFDHDDPIHEHEWRLTGGDVAPALVDRLDRDGYADESAPNYNLIVRNQLVRLANILDVSDAACEDDLAGHPKLRRTVRSHYPLLVLDRYMPSIGDSGLTGNPGRKLDADDAASAFERYGEPEFARIAHLLNDRTAEGLHGDVFSADADTLADRIESVVERTGEYDPGSVLEPAYGFAALRDGSRDDGTQRAAWLYFGRNAPAVGTSHCHRDALNLGLYAHELDLAPDLGYPEHTGAWHKGHNWTKNTVSHNTVVVDAEPQHPSRVGLPLRFDEADPVTVCDVAAPDAYPQADEYRRTVAMVPIDGEHSYIVDVFRVGGGDDHVFSFHGAPGTTSVTGLSLDPRDGTLAGPDVQFPDYHDLEYDGDVESGFRYLKNVAVDTDPGARFAVDWDVDDVWNAGDPADDVHLRVTALADVDEVAMADGEPPQKAGNPETLRYLLARRRGSDLQSRFATVLEPFSDDRVVERVDRPDVSVAGDADVVAVRIDLPDGRTDFVASADRPDAEFVVGDRFRARGAVALYSERDGEPERAHLTDGTVLESLATNTTLIERSNPTHLSGRVVDFTTDLSTENRLVVDPVNQVDLDSAANGYLHRPTDGPGNGVYEVEDVHRDGEHVVVDVGSAPTAVGFADPDDPDAGYEYAVESGCEVRIPASTSWSVSDPRT